MAQKKTGHVTLTDVARAAGFAISTVSIVLSEAPLSKHVAASTREHIRAVASKLGYYPDAHARSLRKQSSKTIGVLAFDLSDPYCMPIVRGIHSGLQNSEFLPLVMDAQTERSLFDHHLALLLQRRVEGVIVIASWVFDETNLLADMKKNAVPTLILGRDLTRLGITSYLMNNEEGGRLAMRHILDLGHRKIAVVRGPEEMFDSHPRWIGIKKEAADASIDLDPKFVLQLTGLGNSEHGFEGGRQSVKRLLKHRKAFTAVLAFDDMTALGIVRGLTEAGIRVPEDCSVIGFDDILPARVCTPALTTIHQPLHEMGHDASLRMLSSLQPDSKSTTEKPLLFKAAPTLMHRASTTTCVRRTPRKTDRS